MKVMPKRLGKSEIDQRLAFRAFVLEGDDSLMQEYYEKYDTEKWSGSRDRDTLRQALYFPGLKKDIRMSAEKQLIEMGELENKDPAYVIVRRNPIAPNSGIVSYWEGNGFYRYIYSCNTRNHKRYTFSDAIRLRDELETQIGGIIQIVYYK